MKVNGGITKKYFKLEKGAYQEDPISAYLLILVLEIVIAVIKSNQNIDKWFKTFMFKTFELDFLYTAYANDTTFFVKSETFVIEIVKIFDNFSKISDLKPNKSK